MTVSTAQYLPDRLNLAGSAAQIGSTSGADSNDPTRLVVPAGKYADIPNAIANRLTKITSVPADTTTLEVIARFQALSTSATMLVGTESTHLYAACTNGQLSIGHLNTSLATAGGAASPSNIPGFAVNRWYWAKMRLTFSSALCEYWYSEQDTELETEVSWESLGSATGANAGTTPHLGSIGRVTIGAHSSGAVSGPKLMQFGSMQWGTQPVVQWRASGADSETLSDGFTIFRAATGRKTMIVSKPSIATDAVDDYVLLPAGCTPGFTATTGKWTQILAGVWAGADVSNGRLWSSESAGNNGAYLHVGTAGGSALRATVAGSGGTAVTAVMPGAGLAIGERYCVGLIQDEGMMRIRVYGRGSTAPASTAGAGAITHLQPRLFVRAGSTSSPSSGVLSSCMGGPVALTDDEFDTIAARLLGEYR